MRLSLEPVGGWPRPLLMYLMLTMATTVAALQLRRKHGFVRRSMAVPGEATTLNYWYRPAPNSSSNLTGNHPPVARGLLVRFVTGCL
jgi:hypothetical protein